ncbi:hypothetical protein [Streptomyces sp. NPDC058108]|uniref:hypothetical protein n=1 Tax=Streptomyces sp. NPDC058108 TaxID=3346344 RepID=UPI0036EAE4E2
MGVLGTVGASAAGWVGDQGVFTARECHLVSNGKGGKSTVCSGVFVADDETLTDRHAYLSWLGGRAGRETRVNTVVLGGYQEQGADDFAVIVLIMVALGGMAVVCGVAALSPQARYRLAGVSWPAFGRRGRRSP